MGGIKTFFRGVLINLNNSSSYLFNKNVAKIKGRFNFTKA